MFYSACHNRASDRLRNRCIGGIGPFTAFRLTGVLCNAIDKVRASEHHNKAMKKKCLACCFQSINQSNIQLTCLTFQNLRCKFILFNFEGSLCAFWMSEENISLFSIASTEINLSFMLHAAIHCTPDANQLSIDHGNVACTGNNVGSYCTYLCDHGYRLDGQAIRICTSSGRNASWYGNDPTCRGKSIAFV